MEYKTKDEGTVRYRDVTEKWILEFLEWDRPSSTSKDGHLFIQMFMPFTEGKDSVHLPGEYLAIAFWCVYTDTSDGGIFTSVVLDRSNKICDAKVTQEVTREQAIVWGQQYTTLATITYQW